MILLNSVILGSGPHFQASADGSSWADVSLPDGVPLYYYSPFDSGEDLVFLLAEACAGVVSISRPSGNTGPITIGAGYIRIAAGSDAEKLARFIGMYSAPDGWGYYQAVPAHSETLNRPFGVMPLPASCGYLHDAPDLRGTPEPIEVRAVADSGHCAVVSSGYRRSIRLRLGVLSQSYVTNDDIGSNSSSWNPSFWQFFDPEFFSPYYIFSESSGNYRYSLAAFPSAEPLREDWHEYWRVLLDSRFLEYVSA